MVQRINLNQNNRFVLAHRYSVLGEITGPILQPLVGLMAGRQAGSQAGRQAEKIQVSLKFLKFSTG